MLIIENVLLALSSLLSNKMRAVLTMLGIIIGISSVIAIMSIGNSISNSVMSSMNSIGANDVILGITEKEDDEVLLDNAIITISQSSEEHEVRDVDKMTDDMLEEMKVHFGSRLAGIAMNEPCGTGVATRKGKKENIEVYGVNDDYVNATGSFFEKKPLLYGRALSERDQKEARKVALVSDHLVNEIFDGDFSSAYGNEVEVTIGDRVYQYTIVGIYQYQNEDGYTGASKNVVSTIYIPYETALRENHNEPLHLMIKITPKDGVDPESFGKEVAAWMTKKYYSQNEYFKIESYSMASLLDELTSMLSTISIAISAIAAISLLVGGIGVMNIMLVSITERTKEIGTRKALGATNGSIRLQFIMESIVICLIGGGIGIILGLLMATGATALLGFEANPSIPGIVIAVLFSVAIGVFFGYYPANKAAKMDPIEALRYE